MPFQTQPYPIDPRMARYIREQFAAFELYLSAASFVLLPELFVAPSEPQNGMIVYADGTQWNPGAGEGFYGYQAGAWVKL